MPGFLLSLQLANHRNLYDKLLGALLYRMKRYLSTLNQTFDSIVLPRDFGPWAPLRQRRLGGTPNSDLVGGSRAHRGLPLTTASGYRVANACYDSSGFKLGQNWRFSLGLNTASTASKCALHFGGLLMIIYMTKDKAASYGAFRYPRRNWMTQSLAYTGSH